LEAIGIVPQLASLFERTGGRLGDFWIDLHVEAVGWRGQDLALRPDYDDMLALWSRYSFDAPATVVERYYAAYPHEERDAYLVTHVAEIARVAGLTGST
jgi:hypothetical protein